MNIFFLDHDPYTSAGMLCDKHIRKMGLEAVQMLSTAHHVLDGKETKTTTKNGRRLTTFVNKNLKDVIYKASYINHPSTKWVRSGSGNYIWLLKHASTIFFIYNYRFGKSHKSDELLKFLTTLPCNMPRTLITDPPLCMPDIYKRYTTVESYREYYFHDKIIDKNLGVWTDTNIPQFVSEMIKDYKKCPIMTTNVPYVENISKNSKVLRPVKPHVKNRVQTVEKYLQWSK